MQSEFIRLHPRSISRPSGHIGIGKSDPRKIRTAPKWPHYQQEWEVITIRLTTRCHSRKQHKLTTWQSAVSSPNTYPHEISRQCWRRHAIKCRYISRHHHFPDIYYISRIFPLNHLTPITIDMIKSFLFVYVKSWFKSTSQMCSQNVGAET